MPTVQQATQGLGLKARGNPASHTRNGISILEVLISIFIIAIGILGIAALLPLAEHMAARGLNADRAAIGGLEGTGQFVVREMNNPDYWLSAAGAAYSLDPTVTTSPLYPSGAKAYCFDPRLVARDPSKTVFPTAGSPVMERITLRQVRGGAAMSTALADEVFSLHDDLHFIAEEGQPTPPVQAMFMHDPGTPANKSDDTAVKRLTDGNYSWLATLVREGHGDRYTLSVVIVHKRQDPLGTGKGDVNIPGANVTMYGGIGGGEIEIIHANATHPHLSTGNWIMLSSGPVFRWYRIIYASDVDAANRRNLTLAGRDWNTTSYPKPQVTIVPGAIAAYERTVRLETSSLWGK